MLNQPLAIAIILASVILASAWVMTNRYRVVPVATSESAGAYVYNTLTGSMQFCTPGRCWMVEHRERKKHQ